MSLIKKQSLVKAGDVTTAGFMDAVKAEYVKKYAQDVVAMLSDQKKLQKALDHVTKAIKEVEAGNYDAIEKYRKNRKRLEVEDDYEFV